MCKINTFIIRNCLECYRAGARRGGGGLCNQPGKYNLSLAPHKDFSLPAAVAAGKEQDRLPDLSDRAAVSVSHNLLKDLIPPHPPHSQMQITKISENYSINFFK